MSAEFVLRWVHRIWLLLSGMWWCGGHCKSTNTGTSQMNVLLIMFDDMRPEFPFYGKEHIIAPNFQKLADRSVIFDNAHCQVAVCNPSRNSFMTGLRPDTTGSYNFQQHWSPHIPFQAQFVRMGYNTAGYGKIQHWESGDKKIWSFDSWENDWYGYQGRENDFMNSSVMPDKTIPETKFRDWEFTTRAVEALEKLSKPSSKQQPFLLGLGFKLPHLAVHIPYKYFEMYKTPEMLAHWQLTKKELKFPSSVSEVSYRCCAEPRFRYMNGEGAEKHTRSVHIQNIDRPVPLDVHQELMMGYAASVTFLDTLVGRLLAVMDKRNLWENTIVVMTSDHGMHNGEKGIWEKWTLFEEATHVPLLIAHPHSPYKGQHYTLPVELIDIYPTLSELTFPSMSRQELCDDKKLTKDFSCWPLDGQSLVPAILGSTVSKSNSTDANNVNATDTEESAALWLQNAASNNERRYLRSQSQQQELQSNSRRIQQEPPALTKDFAITQASRCAPRNKIPQKPLERIHNQTKLDQHHSKHQRQSWAVWNDCDVTNKGRTAEAALKEMSLLGYSMRTAEYRYTAYFEFNRSTMWPNLTVPQSEGGTLVPVVPYEEELFDHKNETLAEFTHRELVNLAYHSLYAQVVQKLRQKLVEFAVEVLTRRDERKSKKRRPGKLS